MNAPGLLKLRLFAARHRRGLIVVLLAIGLVSTAGAGWAYANPGETTETEQRHPQTITGAVGTSAVVTGETSVYEQGTQLSDRRVYLLSASPNLTLESRVDTPEGSEIHQRLVLQYRATRDNRVVWEERRVLAADEAGSLETTVNVSRVRERASRIQGEFGSAASIDLRLRYVVDYETDRYDGALNSTVPLTLTQRAYIVDGDLAVEETQTTAVTVSRQQPPDYAVVGPLAGLGLFLTGGAAALAFRRPLSVRDADAEKLQRQRYAEWISAGRVPVFSADQRVEMESLADLVNVAIDSNDRVLYDRDQDIYGVLREGGSLFWYSSSQSGLVDTSIGRGSSEGTVDWQSTGAFDRAPGATQAEPDGLPDGGEEAPESGSERDGADS